MTVAASPTTARMRWASPPRNRWRHRRRSRSRARCCWDCCGVLFGLSSASARGRAAPAGHALAGRCRVGAGVAALLLPRAPAPRGALAPRTLPVWPSYASNPRGARRGRASRRARAELRRRRVRAALAARATGDLPAGASAWRWSCSVLRARLPAGDAVVALPRRRAGLVAAAIVYALLRFAIAPCRVPGCGTIIAAVETRRRRHGEAWPVRSW